ncbi:aminotransferase class III-fold pyridoxal phosphate-dependent enzyme [Neorhizobium sp. NPDC001467]|uniref:aminotransferase class III-fold pyridoxal phosphate-dependent enzyme n=1 Tax=Neorhizobium sp. NPDC001467 TaxID=3390595 RepID=UPI003D03AA3C
MSDPFAETISHPQRPDENTPLPAIEQTLRAFYGLSGQAKALDDPQTAYLIDNGHMRYRLDRRDVEGAADLALEAKILRHLARKADAPDAPEPVATQHGSDIAVAADDGGWSYRLVTMPEGVTPPPHRLDETDMAGIGRLAAELTKALADFDEPGLERSVDSDLRHAGPVVLRLLSNVGDHAVRDPIAKVLVAALRQVQPLAPMLRIQPVHHDLALRRLTGRRTDEGRWRADGITDVGAVVRGWLVAGLAVTCADLMAHGGDDPFDILPAVRGFNDTFALNEPELRALWPLTVARACVLAARAEHETVTAATGEASAEKAAAAGVTETDRYGPDAKGQAVAVPDPAHHFGRKVFAVATGVHPSLMEAAILDVTGFDGDQPSVLSDDICRLLPEIDVEQIRLVDLGIDSPLLLDGNWTDPDIDWRLLARVSWETHMGATRYGEYRLSRSIDRHGEDADNHALHVDICVPAGSVVVAPFGGMLKEVGQQLVLVGRDATLYLEGLVCPLSEGMALFAEDAIGSVAGAEGSVGGLRIRLCRHPEIVPPLFTTPSRAGAWRRLCPSPSQLLGIDIDAPVPKRGEPVRGWRAHVYDGLGQALTDLSGSAGIVGHGHSTLAQAAYRQWLLGASHGAGGLEQRFRERLLATLPAGLDTIVAIGSETDMMEQAQRLSRSENHHPSIVGTAADEQAGSQPTLRIADERETGFGRLGRHLWKFEGDDTLPDLVVIGSIVPGKPLAVLVTRSDLAGLTDLPIPGINKAEGPSGIHNRSSGGPDAVDFAMAAAALSVLRDEALQENARVVGDHLRAGLVEAVSDHRIDIRGEGLALELVCTQPVARALSRALLSRAVLVSPSDDPHRLMLRPPLCLDRETADHIVRAISEILAERAFLEEKSHSTIDIIDGQDNERARTLSAEDVIPI